MIGRILAEIFATALVVTAFWAFLKLIGGGDKPIRISCPPGTEHEGYEIYNGEATNRRTFVCKNCTYRVDL